MYVGHLTLPGTHQVGKHYVNVHTHTHSPEKVMADTSDSPDEDRGAVWSLQSPALFGGGESSDIPLL